MLLHISIGGFAISTMITAAQRFGHTYLVSRENSAANGAIPRAQQTIFRYVSAKHKTQLCRDVNNSALAGLREGVKRKGGKEQDEKKRKRTTSRLPSVVAEFRPSFFIWHSRIRRSSACEIHPRQSPRISKEVAMPEPAPRQWAEERGNALVRRVAGVAIAGRTSFTRQKAYRAG